MARAAAAARAADAPRPLHPLLRDQHVIAGIGRSWVDEILWQRQLSPFKRGDDLDEDERARLRESIVETLGGAIAHYEQVVALPIPDKLPMPLQVHRHEGEPCPRCATTLEAVHFEDYVIAYCPTCQTAGACSRTGACRACCADRLSVPRRPVPGAGVRRLGRRVPGSDPGPPQRRTK